MGNLENIPKEMGILIPFAELLGTKVENNRVVIPEQYGKGYVAAFVFSKHIAMMVNNYLLYEEIAYRSRDYNLHKNMIFFKFQNVVSESEVIAPERKTTELPSVLISTMGLNADIVVPGNTHRTQIYIIVGVNYLRELISSPEKTPVVQNILKNNQQLLFDQLVSPSLQKVANEIITENMGEPFELFFYRIKAEELVCRLLSELGKREEKRIYPLNVQDIQTIYKVRERMLENPAAPLTIEELALLANMSQSKLKRLFKQIFGKGVFSYFQEFRMKEAARLLKEEKLSVSEVGYRLGFSNLSHFTRVFEEHIGMKPKRYSME
jgi:AraC-like DNA-binding protein